MLSICDTNSSFIVQDIFNSTHTIMLYLLYHSYEDYEHKICVCVSACRIRFFLDRYIVTVVGVFGAVQSQRAFLFGGDWGC